MIVLDANILVRAVLGRRVRDLLERYAQQGVRFIAPDVAFADAEHHLPPVLKKFGKQDVDVYAAMRYLRLRIETLDQDLYSTFELEARKRLHGTDEDDWPVLASALALGCAVWTEDLDFFGIGITVWNTSRIEILLESEVRNIKVRRKLTDTRDREGE